METALIKPYESPVVEVLNVELEQSVLHNSMNTENLNEETFNW